MYQSQLSNKAYNGLVKILDYTIRRFGKKQKAIYKKEILDKVSSICNMPTMGHKRDDIPSHLFSYPVGVHVLIYSVNEAQKTVTILRILLSPRMNFSDQTY